MVHVGGVALCLSVLERMLDERQAYAADDTLFGEVGPVDPEEAARNEGAIIALKDAIAEIKRRSMESAEPVDLSISAAMASAYRREA